MTKLLICWAIILIGWNFQACLLKAPAISQGTGQQRVMEALNQCLKLSLTLLGAFKETVS